MLYLGRTASINSHVHQFLTLAYICSSCGANFWQPGLLELDVHAVEQQQLKVEEARNTESVMKHTTRGRVAICASLVLATIPTLCQLHPDIPARYRQLPSLREQAEIQDSWRDERLDALPELMKKYNVDAWLVSGSTNLCSLGARRLSRCRHTTDEPA